MCRYPVLFLEMKRDGLGCCVHRCLSRPPSAGMNIVVGSHDIHVGKLLGREDETRAAEIRAMSDMIENRRREERYKCHTG